MDAEGKFWVAVWGVVLTAAVMTIAIVADHDKSVTYYYTSQEYCQTTVTGASHTVWQKCSVVMLNGVE